MGAIIEQSFENSTLANLSKAFEATWEVLHTGNPPRDAEAEDDLRLAVSGKLLQLAANGVTDPKELQNRVLESLDGIVLLALKRHSLNDFVTGKFANGAKSLKSRG